MGVELGALGQKINSLNFAQMEKRARNAGEENVLIKQVAAINRVGDDRADEQKKGKFHQKLWLQNFLIIFIHFFYPIIDNQIILHTTLYIILLSLPTHRLCSLLRLAGSLGSRCLVPRVNFLSCPSLLLGFSLGPISIRFQACLHRFLLCHLHLGDRFQFRMRQLGL